MRPLSTSLLLALCASLPAQKSPTRSFDVGFLLGHESDWHKHKAQPMVLTLPGLTPLARFDPEQEEAEHIAFPPIGLAPRQLLQLLQPHVGEAGALKLRGDRLHLRASMTAQAAVEDLLGALAEAIRPQLQVELLIFEQAPPISRAVLSPAQVQTLLEAHTPKHIYRRRISGDVPFELGNLRQQRLIRGSDLEVAQRAKINYSREGQLATGLRLAGIVATMADGRLRVLVGSQRSRVETPIPLARFRREGMDQIHLPTVHSRSMWSSGILDAGGALALGTADGEYGLQLLRLRRATPRRDVARAGRFQAMPLGGLNHPTPRARGIIIPRDVGSGRPRYPEAEHHAQGSWQDALVLELEEDQAATPLEIVANHLLLQRGEADNSPLQRRLEAWAKAQQNCSLEIRAGLLPAERARAYLRGESRLPAFVQSIPSRGALAVLPGQSVLFVQGKEQQHIARHRAEIAQRATGIQPGTAVAFSGVSLHGSLQASSLGLQFRGHFLYADSKVKAIDPGSDDGKHLGLRRSDLVKESFRGAQLIKNRWVLLLLQPTESGSYAALALRVK